jgi:hypothetical protein
MKKGTWITLGVVAGAGVAGYFLLRKPKWEVVNVTESNGKVIYDIKIGWRTMQFESSPNAMTGTVSSFPLFTFSFDNVPDATVKGAPAVDLKITQKIGGSGKPQTIRLTGEKGQKG